MQGTFKRDNKFEKRLELCHRIKKQYPDRIPVITETINVDINLNHKKFLIPNDISIGGFLSELRKHTTLRPEEAMYIFCGSRNAVLVPTNQIISQTYEKYKDDDGFLYITVALENTFGAYFVLEQFSQKLLDSILKSSEQVISLLHLNF